MNTHECEQRGIVTRLTSTGMVLSNVMTCCSFQEFMYSMVITDSSRAGPEGQFWIAGKRTPTGSVRYTNNIKFIHARQAK